MSNDLLLYSGSSNRELAANTGRLLDVPLGNLEIVRFPDGDHNDLDYFGASAVARRFIGDPSG